MKQEILLSISIMVSGREETTEKCIASLERLRKKVPCELILTDTGCSQELRKWLESKADRVISFTWCNDFAAARNVGLKAATGKWFLFMDDDEWFEDTTQIEQFFLSGEYRQYESAFYIVRNYANMEGTIWRDTPIVRMTKRRDNTQFFYPIHEVLWPVLEPVKQLEDYVHHYGYASDDPVVQKAKRDRNLSLLLPAIKEDPGCMHHYLQAVSEYIAANEYDAALQLAKTGVEHYDSSRGENGNHIHGLYASVVRLLVRKAMREDTTTERGRRNAAEIYGRAVQEGEKFLESVALSKLARASIYGDLTIACSNTEREEKASDYLWKYLRLKDYFMRHREIWTSQQTIILDSCFEDYQYQKVMGSGMAIVLASDRVQELEKLLGMEITDWWMVTVQKWYTGASEKQREKWKTNFEKMVSETDNDSNARALFSALTMPEQRNHEQANSQKPETAVTQTAPTAEMELLAVQLKEKIRLLIEQGQGKAALQAVIQLKKFFPEDEELKQCQMKLEKQS